MARLLSQRTQRALFIAVIGFFSTGLQASMTRPVGEKERVEKAPFLCAVRINKVTTKRTNEHISRILDTSIIRCFKGDLSSKINLILPGGTFEIKHGKHSSEKITTVIPGIPKIQKNDTLILSLKSETDPGLYSLYDWKVIRLKAIKLADQTKYTIEQSSEHNFLPSPRHPELTKERKEIQRNKISTLDEYAAHIQQLLQN